MKNKPQYVGNPFPKTTLAIACAMLLPLVALADDPVIYNGNNGPEVLADRNLKQENNDQYLIQLYNGADLSVTNTTLEGGGLSVNDDSKVKFEGGAIVSHIGLNVRQQGGAELVRTTIATEGDDAGAVGAYILGGKGDFKEVVIEAASDQAVGLWVDGGDGGDGGGELKFADGSIKVRGEGAAGLLVGFESDAKLNNSNIEVVGLGAKGISASGDFTTVNMSGGKIAVAGDFRGAGVVVDDAAEVKLEGVRVDTRGSAWGAKVYRGGSFEMDGGLMTSGEPNGDPNIGGGIEAGNDASIKLGGGTEVYARNGVLFALLNDASNVRLQMRGGAKAYGDIVATYDDEFDDALVANPYIKPSVSLSEGSIWTGGTRDLVGVMALASDAEWKVARNSSVDTLQMDRGFVSFLRPENGNFKTLTVNGDLSGQGTFRLNTDLSTEQGDLLKVEGVVQGVHTLVVQDSGRDAAPDAKLTLVETNGGVAADSKFVLHGNQVDVGAYRYVLQQNNERVNLVMGGGVQDANTGTVVPVPVPVPVPVAERLSKSANAAVGHQAASTALISAQQNALVKRLGDLRMGGDDGGLWTRGFDKEQHINTGSSRAFQQQVKGFEIGADKAVPLSDGKLYIGGIVGQGRGTQSFGEGAKGSIDTATLGGYATFVYQDGLHVDGVLKYTHLDNKIDITNNLGNRVDAKFKNHALSASVEVGKQVGLGKGWFVEPQVEVQALRVNAGGYTASNGLSVEQDAMTSVQSRFGGVFGRNLKLESGLSVQPYAKASWITEHAGEGKVKVNSANLDSKLPGSRAEVGAGVVMQVAQKHKIYVDGEYAKGSHIEQPWAINAGYRYTW